MVFYGTIYDEVKIDKNDVSQRNEVNRILGELSEESYGKFGYMISSIVVTKETNMPGEGYYGLYEELSGKDSGFDAWVEDVKKVYGSFKT